MLDAGTPQVSTFDSVALAEFYARISAEQGIAIGAFRSELERLFGLPRTREDLDAYRLSRSPWKRLADEVIPVLHLLDYLEITEGRIRFPLDNDPPDCLLWRSGECDPDRIEVTIAQARERFHLAREMLSRLIGRGFIGLSDDAPSTHFEEALSRRRSMYATTHALLSIHNGVLRCLRRKNRSVFSGMILLIQAPLLSLPPHHWSSLREGLLAAAANSPFQRIYVISNASEHPRGFDIK